jgi:hypothetical protein
LSCRAFPYVIWIPSQGGIQPLYPWRDYSWARCKALRPVAQLALPDAHLGDKYGFYPLNSEPGIETVILLVAQYCLSASALRQLKDASQELISECRSIKLPDNARVFLFTKSRGRVRGQATSRLGAPRTLEDPLVSLGTTLIRHCDAFSSLIVAKAFATTKEVVSS